MYIYGRATGLDSSGDDSRMPSGYSGGEEAEAEPERTRPGLTTFTDGSRLDDGAAGYSAVWQNGQFLMWCRTEE